MQLCIQVVYFCGWAESLGMGTPSTESQCCLVTFIVTNVAPDNHCELDLQSKSVQIPNHASPEPWSSQTNQVSLLNHTSIVLEEPFLRIFVALRTLLVFLVCCSGELWPCVLCLAVTLLSAQVLTGFESNLFWQAASDFNASKLLRGKILSVYLASYLEIWRLWGQLKHELIPN